MKTTYIFLSSLIITIAFAVGMSTLMYLTSAVTNFKHNTNPTDCKELLVTNKEVNRQHETVTKEEPDVACLKR
jgi:hypothetical protein